MLRTCALIAAAVLLSLPAFADDAKEARVRKARAALALAGHKEVAPSPKALLTYDQARTVAIEKNEPLIVFLGGAESQACPNGAVCVKTESLAGYSGQMVVICYPVNGKLIDSAILNANASKETIQKAFEEAAVKSREANPVPKEQHEDDQVEAWFITADAPDLYDVAAAPPVCVGPNCPADKPCNATGVPIVPLKSASCACGASCPCAAKAMAAFTGSAVHPARGIFHRVAEHRPHLFSRRR